jgi:alanyl-tRNA synthetase
VLGSHAHQAGSLVEAGRLRFDFSHFAATSPEELVEVEAMANSRLIEDGRVTTTVTSKEEAEKMGALAFFGDKYGERVRVVTVGEFSVEFCGGTHTNAAGQVGPLVVIGESSIGSNLRRVEALTGEDAYRHLREVRSQLIEAGSILRVPAAEVPGRIRGLLDRLDQLEDQLDAHRMRERVGQAEDLVRQRAVTVGSARMLVAEWPDLANDQLRLLALTCRDKLERGVVVLGSGYEGKGNLIAAVSKDLAANGVSAADIVSGPAKLLGGGGSRDPELAQAGGPKGDQLTAALELAYEIAGRALAAV